MFTPDNTNSCDDGLFCNGSEGCMDGFCGMTLTACGPPPPSDCAVLGCDEENDVCLLIGDDSLCD